LRPYRKKKTESEAGNGEALQEKACRIECELGEIETKSHKAITAEGSPYNSGEELFEPCAPREKFKSNRFMELALDYCQDMSDRAATRRLNRLRHETGGIKTATCRNTAEREGMKIVEHIEAKREAALYQKMQSERI
jgi:hypothetical protein